VVAASPAAVTYVHASQALRQVTKQSPTSLSIHGIPLTQSTGTVSLASGIEYPDKSVDTDVESISLASGFISNNPEPLYGTSSLREGLSRR
jgi:hypothetical protein